MSATHISVVIIFLNGAAFLEEAIESVRLQTHTCWELLLVDDGSTDGGSLIARRAADADPLRVRYLQHPDGANHGTSASRNLGAAHAQGSYLLFLDCDDLLLPDNLTRHADALDEDPTLAAVFSPTLFWLWDRAYAADDDSIQPVGSFANRRISAPDLLVAMLRDECLHPANCGTLFRRTFFAACGGFDESFRGMYEDTALLTKVLLNHPTYMLADCLSAYRAHRASQCNSARQAGEYDPSGPSSARSGYLLWARQHIQQQQLPDQRVIRAIERELQASHTAAPASGRARLVLTAGRLMQRASRLLRGRQRDARMHGVLAVLERIHCTYNAMHRNREAAAITARIAELEAR